MALGTGLGAVFLRPLAVLAQPAPPAPVASELAQPRLAGSSRFTYWGFDVYQASLWVEPDFDAAAVARQRLALELQYLRGFKGREIAQRSIDEMRRQANFGEAKAQTWLQAMSNAFPDVANGDRLLGLYLPGRGARFYANGRLTAEIMDAEFAQLFFGIWLSERTSEPRLRLALLGAGSNPASAPGARP